MTGPNVKIGHGGRVVGALNTAVINNRVAYFTCPIEAQAAYLDDLDRQICALRGERERVAALLRQLRGVRAYAEAVVEAAE